MGNNNDFGNTASVKNLLAMQGLAIPEYQRPYKWTTKNVSQLLDDLDHYGSKYRKKNHRYRLGTIVFHDDGNRLKIVDGQQRTVTLYLIAKAFDEAFSRGGEVLDSLGISDHLEKVEGELSFTSSTSYKNIRQNYDYIKRYIKRNDKNERLIRFIFEQCEVVYFILDDVSEAFQFFDSQNARGKELHPHNLLKAYHLREFTSDEETKEEVVADWEDVDPKKLGNLFGKYLFRIKRWIYDSSAREFTKDDVDLFKGLNLNSDANYPYLTLFKLGESNNRMQYQLEYPIFNGSHFFKFVSHYYDLYQHASEAEIFSNLTDRAAGIMKVMNGYEGHYRTGDRYVRTLFNCALMYYLDKFGDENKEALSDMIEHVFIWSYQLRLKQKAVYWASVDKHVLNDNLFKVMRKAVIPSDITSHTIVVENENRSIGTKIHRFRVPGTKRWITIFG